jgi:CO dehydrogenase/acetyl-CoA synthase beta subunit
MVTPEELKNNLFDFAESIADIIGTEETNEMLTQLTTFAKSNPETVIEIRNVIEENPDAVASLMTKKGIQEAKEMISLVQNMNIF